MKKIIALLCVYLGFISWVFADDIRFVQVTDIRYSKADDNGLLSEFVQEVNKLEDVSFIVFSGNNINNPNIKNLEGFIKEAKKLRKPFYVLIGDKDVNKHKNLSKIQYASYLKKKLRNYWNTNTNYVFERDGIVFIVVDGSRDIVPSSVGYYKDGTLKWLETKLDKYSNKNIVILQHYPLISPDGKEVTFHPERYLELLASHKNVKAVVSGTKYRSSEQDKDEIVHISTAQFPYYRVIDILDCKSSNPTIWAEIKELKK